MNINLMPPGGQRWFREGRGWINFDAMTLAEQRWWRAWKCQISYAEHATSRTDFDHYCKNAMVAHARYLMAQVTK